MSWSFCAILVRDSLLPLVRLEVGDGWVCHVWTDPWLPKGPILERYGEWMIYDAATVKEANLSYFISTTEFW